MQINIQRTRFTYEHSGLHVLLSIPARIAVHDVVKRVRVSGVPAWKHDVLALAHLGEPP